VTFADRVAGWRETWVLFRFRRIHVLTVVAVRFAA
jgi:hypothetical protein